MQSVEFKCSDEVWLVQLPVPVDCL